MTVASAIHGRRRPRVLSRPIASRTRFVLSSASSRLKARRALLGGIAPVARCRGPHLGPARRGGCRTFRSRGRRMASAACSSVRSRRSRLRAGAPRRHAAHLRAGDYLVGAKVSENKDQQGVKRGVEALRAGRNAPQPRRRELHPVVRRSLSSGRLSRGSCCRSSGRREPRFDGQAEQAG